MEEEEAIVWETGRDKDIWEVVDDEYRYIMSEMISFSNFLTN